MGDSACWLDRVALECGRFVDRAEVNDEKCRHCGAEGVSFTPSADG